MANKIVPSGGVGDVGTCVIADSALAVDSSMYGANILLVGNAVAPVTLTRPLQNAVTLSITSFNTYGSGQVISCADADTFRIGSTTPSNLKLIANANITLQYDVTARQWVVMYYGSANQFQSNFAFNSNFQLSQALNGRVIELTAPTLTVTVSSSMMAGYRAEFCLNGLTTFAPENGTVFINGASAPVTIDAATKKMVRIQQLTAPNANYYLIG